MAASVPNSLKSADIARFATRAAQVEKAKPAVAYWCNYWIVQQIVTKGLHNVDEESKTYTSSLMDKLEEAKIEHPEDDAITDDVAAKAFLEQFGLEIFQRADNAVRANKASRQTADTFQAAYTFLELLQIWPPVDPEIAAKIKFAKYHALRIAKALKAGEDPNLSNPTPEPTPAQEDAPLDPSDPEVQALGGFDSASHQPSVEDVPDEHHRNSATLARTSTLDQSLHPSRAASVPRAPEDASAHNPPPTLDTNAENYYQGTENPEVSPLEPSSAGNAPSVGGGYFPRVPGDSEADRPTLPQAPGFNPGQPSDVPPVSPLQPPTSSPFTQAPPHYPVQPIQPNSTAAPYHQPIPPHVQGSGADPNTSYQMPYQQPPPQQPQQFYTTPVPPMQPPMAPPQSEFVLDEAAIAKAQKHARWAISALNFEDVKTAVEELRGALATLGAR